MAAKICLVSNTAWSFVRFRLDLIKSLINAGHQVILLAPRDEFVGQLESLGARVLLLKSLSAKGLNPLSDIKLYLEFKRIYKAEKPDVIIQYTIKPNIYSTLAASGLKIPTIAVVTGLGYAFINRSMITVIAKTLYRSAFMRASKVWFLNRDDSEFFLNSRLVEPDKMGRMPGEGVNCIDTYNPELFPASVPDPSTITFLFIGRLLYDKGIAEYVTAAKHIKRLYPNTVFWVLGYLNVENPAAVQETQLNAWIREGSIEYLGAVDDVRPIIAKCDCVVLPSYREGMSTTLQESAAMAKPLIATDIPGCKELIEEGKNGYLCSVRDTGSLVSCMKRMIKLTPDERKKMGINGRTRMMNEFAVENIISLYHAAINEMIYKKG